MTKVFLASFLLLARIAISSDATTQQVKPQHVRNFGEVDQTVWRGGAPTDEALRELKSLGVSTVVDLRQEGPGRQHERELVEQLGMRYQHVPLRSTTAPTQDEIKQILGFLLGQPSGKVYVHCLRGKDRTGTVIACYRIQHDGWDNQRALEEAKSYGMSSLEWKMQAFIRHFTPLTLP